VKICGITNVADAEAAASAGVNAIGLNFVPRSKRCIDREMARAIVQAVGRAVEIVGVVADVAPADLLRLRRDVGFGWLQLHGSEEPELVQALLPDVYKAVAVEDAVDVALARSFPGERLLVDTKVAGQSGGSGRCFDWSLVRGLVRERAVIVAGGLTADNVAEAVRLLRPFGVDTASGVEVPGEPGRKDSKRMVDFVIAARQAASRTSSEGAASGPRGES
jgi:phosphoribosylanthranilate isomerase